MAHIARASAVMASGTMVSRLLGFVKAIVLVQAIGQSASVSADAFANGNALPNMIYFIVLGGMLQAVLVPQIVAARAHADGGAAYINKLLTLISAGLFLVTVLAVFCAPLLTRSLAVSWSSEQIELATAFAYWCLPQMFFYGLYTVLGEVLNARNVFGPFTWAPALNNVVAIIGLFAFIWVYGADPAGAREVADWTPGAIALLAGSATLGIMMQALILFLAWRRAGIHYRPDFHWRGMGFRSTMKLGSWALGTVLVNQVVTFVSTNVVNTATGEGPGQLAVQNAWLVFSLPHSVIAVSIATAYFTRLSEAGQSRDMDGYRREFLASTRVVMVIMLLASAMLVACAPYASQLMQVGAPPEQIGWFSLLIQAYAIGLAAFSMLFVVNRAFFALSDTKTPFLIASMQAVMQATLIPVALFLPKPYVASGAAIVVSLSYVITLGVALVMLERKVGNIGGGALLGSAARLVPGAILAAAAGMGAVWLQQRWVPGGSALLDAVWAIVVAAIVAVVYIAVLFVLRASELEAARRAVRARVRR